MSAPSSPEGSGLLQNGGSSGGSKSGSANQTGSEGGSESDNEVAGRVSVKAAVKLAVKVSARGRAAVAAEPSRLAEAEARLGTTLEIASNGGTGSWPDT